MTKSILVTTRATKESANRIRESVSKKEYEKQLYALFNMKQMVVALIFIALYAIYSFFVNLYFIIDAQIIYLPFSSTFEWYFYSKVIIFNLYIYSLIFIIFFYCWLSQKTMKDFAMLSKRKSTATTPDNGDDIIIVPDMMMDTSNANIHHLNNLFDSNSEHNIYNTPGNSRRSSYASKLQCVDNTDAISSNSINIPSPDPISSTKGARSDDSQIDIFPIFNMNLSVRHQARSSLADEINIDGFIEETKKKQPHTTMFDVPIVAMKKRGCSLERIYFDSQKYRGITANSLRLTAKMRSMSYSHNAYLYRHSRNNTKFEENDSNNLTEHEEEEDEETEEEISQISCYSAGSQHSGNNNNMPKQNVQIPALKMGLSKSINITVPEDAVLTPDRVSNSMQIKTKSPQSVDENVMDLEEVISVESENENEK